MLQVNPKADIWQRENQQAFIADMRKADPNATGTPVQLYQYTTLLKESYEQAAWYSLAAISLMVLLHFRSPLALVLALLPVGIGSLWLVGLMGAMGIPFNPANLIALPLILGIGAHDGVPLVHEFRRQRGRFKLSDSTAVAVILTSTTTMASFGSMILARHQGLRSLGQVLTLGVLCCLTSSIVFFPALLSWLTRNREEVQEEEESSEGSDAPESPAPGNMAAAA